MYQPYLRGKQFELIGLRELSESILASKSNKVSPIIEPVKDSSTLKTTLVELLAKDINFTLIVNPQKGTFDNTKKILDLFQSIVGSKRNYQIGVIFHNKLNHSNLIQKLEPYKEIIPSFSIIHDVIFDDIEFIISRYSEISPILYNVLNLDIVTRRYSRNFEKESLIELGDFFISQSKNSDYLSVGESPFSEEHLYYKDEGFIGFSDFLTIGKDYSETGFLPFAVAIHLSFPDNKNRIRVKHFVSNSNDDNSDIAGKFSEAIEKLIKWCNESGYDSIAIRKFRELYNGGNVHFPGLGTIKKLSMMNHIELVLKLMN